ncbi:MAG: hypothetical protein WA421_16545 [Nitrososphaeraceae archaeon]
MFECIHTKDSKASDNKAGEVKSQADCDFLCGLGKNAKSLWDALTKGGKSGDITDSLKLGLESPKIGLIQQANVCVTLYFRIVYTFLHFTQHTIRFIYLT